MIADETRASLVVCSEEMSSAAVVKLLRLEPAELIIMGSPTGHDKPPLHPYHLVRFDSGLQPNERLEKQLEAVLEVAEGRAAAFSTLAANCRLTVYCSYSVREYGGWTISNELCRRMAKMPFEYVFGVSCAVPNVCHEERKVSDRGKQLPDR